jgi:hypothetical protein
MAVAALISAVASMGVPVASTAAAAIGKCGRLTGGDWLRPFSSPSLTVFFCKTLIILP